MKHSWKQCHLGDILTLQRGFDLPERSRVSGEVPIVSSSGITGFHDRAKATAPGIVTGRYGTLGEVHYVKRDFWPLNTTLYVKDFKGNDPLFLSYFLRTLNFSAQNAAGAVPGVNRNHLHLLEVKIPDIATQRKIAGVLSAYDDLMENNTRRMAILEELSQAIYREWFVHFRYPGHEHTPLVDSPLGKIPKGWATSFPQQVDFLEGPGLRRWQYREEGIPFLNIRTIGKNDVDLSKCQYVDPSEVAQKYSHFLLRPLDHIVSSSGTIGRIATIQSHHLPLMLNTSIIRMTPKSESVGRWQLKHFLLSSYFQEQIIAHASGVAQMNFGPSHLKLMWILAPDKNTGVAYEGLVTPIEEKICVLVRKNEKLRKTRDLLLPKLISGQLDVEELDIDTGDSSPTEN